MAPARPRLTSVIAMVASALALGLTLSGGAWADASVSNVRFGGDGDRTRVVVESDAPLEYRVFSLAQSGARIVVDLPRVRWGLDGADIGAGQRGLTGHGVVARVRYAHTTASVSRLVLDLETPALVARHFRLDPSNGRPHRLVIDLERADPAVFIAAAGAAQSAAQPASSAPAGIRAERERRVVVLDPGHGGRDPGATGGGGTREKDVNLAVAALVRDRLVATGRYTVVMTRSDDVYLSLEERVDVARGASADLFISFHADSSSAGPAARGASVYTLSERARDRGRDLLADDDNWLIDVEPVATRPEVNAILVDLAQRMTKNESAVFAQRLIPRLADVGPLLTNTHRKAGFFVLLAPDVPAILLEMGFLSNPDDEDRLSDPRARARIARAVSGAVDDYFANHDRLLAAR